MDWYEANGVTRVLNQELAYQISKQEKIQAYYSTENISNVICNLQLLNDNYIFAEANTQNTDWPTVSSKDKGVPKLSYIAVGSANKVYMR